MTLAGDTISSAVKVSPDAGNDLQIRSNGLYVSSGCDTAIPTDGANFLDASFGPFANPGTYTLGTTSTATVTNPSSHCPVRVFRNWGIAGDIPLEPGARAELWVQFSINGGAFISYLFGTSDLSNIYRTYPIEMNNTEHHGDLNPVEECALLVQQYLEFH